MKTDQRKKESFELFSRLNQAHQDLIIAYMGASVDCEDGLLSAQAEVSFREVIAAQDASTLTSWLRENGYLA